MTDEQKQREVDAAWENYKSKSIREVKLESKPILSEQQNHRCCFCGCRFEEKGDRIGTLEHIVPRAHGGKDSLENWAVSCLRCNKTRGNFVYWPPSENYNDPYYRIFEDISFYTDRYIHKETCDMLSKHKDRK